MFHNLRKKISYELVIAIFVGCLAFILSASYSSGPAYLQDEIGYLSKAALLAGKVVDGSSSYHAGISMLIAPAFLLDDPSKIWAVILAINAMVCAMTVLLLFKIIESYGISTNLWITRGAILICLIYPSMWVMAGYIFPSVYLGVFFLLAVWLSLQEKEGIGWDVCLALVVGFLYWIHPTGLAVCVAFMLAQVVCYFKGHDKSNWKSLLLQLIIVGLMVVIYKAWIHPYMNLLMTPEGQSVKSHYGSFSQQFSKLTSISGLFGLLRAVLGQLSYLVVSTLGLGFFGLFYLSVNAWKLLFRTNVKKTDAADLFILLSVLGLLAMGGIAMAVPNRIDHVIYGRYQECVYALLIIFGFIYVAKARIAGGSVRKNFILAASIFAVMTLGMLLVNLGMDGVVHNNIVNTIGMYPQYLFKESGLVFWLGVGLATILVLLLAGPWSYLPAIIALSFVAVKNQIEWHEFILGGHSKPSAFVSLILDRQRVGDCIAFDFDGMSEKKLSLRQKEQFDAFKFYFLDYEYKRMNFASWLNKCNGPLLTYSPEKYIENKNIVVDAKDIGLGLFMLSRVGESRAAIAARPGIYINDGSNLSCLLEGCYEMYASDLLAYSQNGVLSHDFLSEDLSKGRGYLFFGPYYRLGAGAWRVDLDLENFSNGEYVLDVVSKRGTLVHARNVINSNDWSDRIISLPFDLDERVDDLEVRLLSIKNGDILIKKYKITNR